MPAVVIVSGLSGGGKTAAAKLFEDLGYIVVDNLPGELLPDLAELVSSDRRALRAGGPRPRRPGRRPRPGPLGDARGARRTRHPAHRSCSSRPATTSSSAASARRATATRSATTARHRELHRRGAADARPGPHRGRRRPRHLGPVAARAARAAVRPAGHRGPVGPAGASSSSASASSTACRSRPTSCSTSGSWRTRSTSPSSGRCPG